MNREEQKLNVLFLASWYPNRVLPKNGNFIQRHAQAVALNCRVTSLHVISDEQASDFEIVTNEVNGVFEVIVYYPKTTSLLPLRKFNRYLKAHRIGFEKIQQEFGQIDIAHLNVFYPAGIFALELKKKYQIPFIITENWTAFLPINPYQFNAFERYYIKKIGAAASVLCPVSEDLKKAFVDFGFEGPFRIIPNVADTNTFKLGEPIDKNPIKILHVSTFKDQHKNINGILNVIARLHADRSDFEVTMAGNKFGNLYDDKIKSLGIPDNILTIHPELPIEEIARLMQEHHIFILFSNYENLPCVVVEAHSSGMVVIGSDVGGTREMISPENGVIIEAKAEDQLYQQLHFVIDNLSKYNRANIRKEAVARYSYQSVGDEYLEVYKDVLK